MTEAGGREDGLEVRSQVKQRKPNWDKELKSQIRQRISSLLGCRGSSLKEKISIKLKEPNQKEA